MTDGKSTSFRTLLVLARASNLPTVWSNCLAGWILGGGSDWIKFPLLCLGATFLYTGGMFLNDAFDADFDRRYRPERPIPSGAITEKEVWRWGINLLALGSLLLVWMSVSTAIATVLLVLSILLYDVIHKLVTFSPVIMSLCRFFLYLVASAAAHGTITGLAVWSGLALAFYIVGLSYIARKESAGGVLRSWPVLLLFLPIALAWYINDETRAREMGIYLSTILALWIAWCLRHIFQATQRNIGKAVSGLLAGIALVDLIAVTDHAGEFGIIFTALFVFARIFQKFIPAT